MKEKIACKVTGDVLKVADGVATIRTIGKDNKGELHEDMHTVVHGGHPIESGGFVTVIGKIIDIDRTQLIQAGSIELAEAGPDNYRNVAEVYGFVEKETVLYPRKLDESTGKVKQPFANVTIKSLGTRIFGTLFGALAINWKNAGPIGSECVLYGRMRRKEMKAFDDGPPRRYIDIASDDFNFPGQSSILKRGAGAKNEFAGMDATLLAFTQGVMETPEPEKKPGRKAK
jgi:hypothetical protein